MNQAMSAITLAVVQLMLFALFSLVISHFVAQRIAKTKTGREAARKLIMLGLLSAFFLLFLLPQLAHQ